MVLFMVVPFYWGKNNKKSLSDGLIRKRLEKDEIFVRDCLKNFAYFCSRVKNMERRCVTMDMELLTNQELSAIKGGEWVFIDGEWVWIDNSR